MNKRIIHATNKSCVPFKGIWDYNETPYYEIDITIRNAGFNHLLAREEDWYIIVSTVLSDCGGNYKVEHKIYQSIRGLLYSIREGELKIRGKAYNMIWKAFLDQSNKHYLKDGFGYTLTDINELFNNLKPV